MHVEIVNSLDEEALDWSVDEEADLEIKEYEIKSTPNDFNVLTIASFMDSGAVHVPGFQRHYVWEIARASRLIESLILGLPIPQTFWYEESSNKFLVIDGQQRLLTVYFFVKGRFPRKEARGVLRNLMNVDSSFIPESVLHDDDLFQDFRLRLTSAGRDKPHPLNGLTYKGLGDRLNQFNLRPIRNMILTQTAPSEDDSSVFEIFHRLNSGGVALRPQEIRASLFYGPFFDLLADLNTNAAWRRLVGDAPQVHMQDMEAILRGFAMALDSENYRPSLPRFLNQFSKTHRHLAADNLDVMRTAFETFVSSFTTKQSRAFMTAGRFSPTLFEASFAAAYTDTSQGRKIDPAKVRALASNADYIKATAESAGHTANVHARVSAGRQVFSQP